MESALVCGNKTGRGRVAMARAKVELEPTLLRDNRWAVRPKGQLGTCGWHPKPWKVFYVTAVSGAEAVRKAEALRKEEGE